MIVDCHTHIWQSPDQLGQLELGDSLRSSRQRTAKAPANRGGWRSIVAADAEHHWAQTQQSAVDKTIVLGFKSRYLNADIPNRYVADYVARYPQRLIGFAGIDPAEPQALEELRYARETLNLRGLTISPADQDFHPADTRAMAVYQQAEAMNMPILLHPVGGMTAMSKMEYARPYLLDEIARSFPKLTLIIAQLGQPWVEETVCLLGKHARVFADISGLLSRPWQAYSALVAAHQSGVVDKLLFGSDFPYTQASQCIESLYSINQVAQGTNLPLVPREALRGIVERDAVAVLGLD